MAIFSLFISVILGVVCAVIASNKNRSAVGWFFGGFFLGIVGIVIISVIKDPEEDTMFKHRVEQENRRLKEQLNQERIKNDTFRQHTYARLDEHDKTLGIDTRKTSLDEHRTHKMIDEYELNNE